MTKRARPIGRYGFEFRCKSFPKEIWTTMKSLADAFQVHPRDVLMVGVLVLRELYADETQRAALKAKILDAKSYETV